MTLIVAVALAPDAHTIEVGAHEGAVLRELVRARSGRAPSRLRAHPGAPRESRARLRRSSRAWRSAAPRCRTRTDESSFQHVVTAPGYSGLRRRDMPAGEEVNEITVPTERLDDVLPEGFEPSFMKIDVEGAELLVLRGAAETIARHRPVIVFEHGAGGYRALRCHPRGPPRPARPRLRPAHLRPRRPGAILAAAVRGCLPRADLELRGALDAPRHELDVRGPAVQKRYAREDAVRCPGGRRARRSAAGWRA